jgi:hypothetical protein
MLLLLITTLTFGIWYNFPILFCVAFGGVCVLACLVYLITVCFRFYKVEKNKKLVLQNIEQEVQNKICTLLSSCLYEHYKNLTVTISACQKRIPSILELWENKRETVIENEEEMPLSIYYLLESSGRKLEFYRYFLERHIKNDEKAVANEFSQFVQKTILTYFNIEPPNPDVLQKTISDYVIKDLIPRIQTSTSFWRLLRQNYESGEAALDNIKKMIEQLQEASQAVFLKGAVAEKILLDQTKVRKFFYVPEGLSILECLPSQNYLVEKSPFDNSCFFVQIADLL